MSTGWRAVADRALSGLGVERGDKVRRYLRRQSASTPNISFAVAGAELNANGERVVLRRPPGTEVRLQ